MTRNPVSPLLLQAQITPPQAGGSFGLADTTRLENPFRAPMWLDEIRFRLPVGSGTGVDPDAWSSLFIELKLGNIPLTKGFVPISLFGKVLNDSQNVGEYANNGAPGVFTWKLPRPLYIPARELLRPTMYYETFSGAPAKTVNIVYVCRPIEKNAPVPRKLDVPWVTFYRPAFLTAAGSDQTDQSSPSDLSNPWNEELHVQRFVGRFMGRNAAGEDDVNMGLASARITLATGAIAIGTLVSAQDSYNNILIRDRTPFAHVFNFIDRAWTVNCILPPKGFYLFTIDRLWSGASGATVATVGISMVGWREVAYRS